MEIIQMIYNYCTDFIIILANFTNCSYYEINFIVFALIYPLCLSAALLVLIIQKWRIHVLLNTVKNKS
jgi:hypothetical protein